MLNQTETGASHQTRQYLIVVRSQAYECRGGTLSQPHNGIGSCHHFVLKEKISHEVVVLGLFCFVFQKVSLYLFTGDLKLALEFMTCQRLIEANAVLQHTSVKLYCISY